MFLVPPGGHLYLKLDFILVKKKNNVIRVVFQDHACMVLKNNAGNVHAYII